LRNLGTSYLNLESNMSRVKLLCSQLPNLSIAESHIAPTEFTFFPELPPELRIKIWGFVANIARKINLRFLDPEAPIDPASLNVRVPPILYSCREAREEALKYYTQCLEYGDADDNSEDDTDTKAVAGEEVGEERELVEAESRATYLDHDLALAKPYTKNIYLNFSMDRFYLEGMTFDERIDRFMRDALQYLNFGHASLSCIQHLHFQWDILACAAFSPFPKPHHICGLVDLTLDLTNWTVNHIPEDNLAAEMYRRDLKSLYTKICEKNLDSCLKDVTVSLN